MALDQKQPLRVSVHGVTDKMRNTLQYFFHGPCNDYCEMVDEGSSDLSIFDLDGLNGLKNLEDYRSKNPEKPLILLSVNNRDIEDGILIRKPLKPDLLISALKTAQQKVHNSVSLLDNTAGNTPENITQSEITIPKVVEKEPESNSLLVEKTMQQNISDSSKTLNPHWSKERQVNKLAVAAIKPYQATVFHELHDDHSYIGSAPDISLNDSSQIKKAQYNPESYFQGYIDQAVSKAGVTGQAVLLTIPDGWIVIRPDTRTVLINIQDSKLRAFSALPITDETITQSLLENSNLTEYSQQASLTSLEHLLWKSAIWSSRGRVPTGTDLTTPILLKQWPNLSRLLLSPHALRIAALWSEYPCSLLDTAKTLHIPQRYVFAFYSACNAIGIATVNQASTETTTKAIPEKKNHKRAFLGRLLERLRAYAK